MKRILKYTFMVLINLLVVCFPLKVNASGITLNKNQTTISKGYTETLTYVISDDSSSTDIIWTSTEPSVATVQNGKVTALNIGTTIITATLNGTRSTCKVTVVNTIPLSKITLNKTSLTIKEKSTATLSVTYSPSNASNKNVTWKSSNSNIVTVNSQGILTGVSAGTATITVVSADGGYVSSCKVTVEAISKNVTSVSLDKKELTITAGETTTLKATINPSYAQNKNITWSSSNENIATVKDGKISAISPGTTEIKVITEDGNKEAICKVTVKSPPIKSISFEESETTVYVGSTTTLNTISEPENSIIENPIWTSSNTEVATVENGEVTALFPGETTITISNQDNSINASIKLIVIDKPKEKLNITVEGYDLKFNPEVKIYNLKIGDESKITINTNIEPEKVTINGNQNLKDGSIITINITDEEKITYIINIEKKQSYTIYFIAVISLLLLLNLIRIIIKNKKKS